MGTIRYVALVSLALVTYVAYDTYNVNRWILHRKCLFWDDTPFRSARERQWRQCANVFYEKSLEHPHVLYVQQFAQDNRQTILLFFILYASGLYLSEYMKLLASELGLDPLLDYLSMGFSFGNSFFAEEQLPDLEPIPEISRDSIEFNDQLENTESHSEIPKNRTSAASDVSPLNRAIDTEKSTRMGNGSVNCNGLGNRNMNGEEELKKPEGWLVYDKVFGLIPKEVQDQWREEEEQNKSLLMNRVDSRSKETRPRSTLTSGTNASLTSTSKSSFPLTSSSPSYPRTCTDEVINSEYHQKSIPPVRSMIT